MSIKAKSKASIHWFRKGLRLHDNPALIEACKNSDKVYPVFIIDPWFAKPDVVGINRYAFLLQSLIDLDNSLKELGSRLFVAKGKPEDTIPALIERWDVSLLTYESDTEPYAVKRDSYIRSLYSKDKLKISTYPTHTLHDPEAYIGLSGGNFPPTTYQSFQKLFDVVGTVRKPQPKPTINDMPEQSTANDYNEDEFHIPSLQEMGYNAPYTMTYPGGEAEALRRLQEYVTSKPDYVCNFEKPMTSPNSIIPSTTVLSPYLKFGCLSSSLFYHELASIYKGKKHSAPPVSLHGQLLWREFFYFSSYTTPNFDQMIGNPKCRQIPWDHNIEKVSAFKEARTGYPFIDAIMTQLKQEGWIHHLARHMVACFFTRGDLWQSWVEGAKIFDLYLLDSDYALNNANWQWLSCSNFFYQYFRCYSPIAFGKKTDPDGSYIRRYVPKLAKYPAKYIYEPWKAPLDVQAACNCIIGKDYPNPIVDHAIVSQENMNKMKKAYEAGKSNSNTDTNENEDIEQNEKPKSSKKKQSQSGAMDTFVVKKQKTK